MAEKDTNLVIAYFASADEAQAAGKSLKEWDKESKYLELGAISILTMDNKGKLKEEKVGAHATGKGAKWGIIAGAALGILSGGATLIGGALVGLAAGALGGSLTHKHIGMTDDDQARLEKHLKDGGVALAVMLDPDEMEGIVYHLNKLDAEVATYNIPQQVLDDAAKMAKADQVIHDLAEEVESSNKVENEADA